MTQNAINNTASTMAIANITIDGNTISSTDANGDVVIAPNGSGTISVTTAPIVPSGDRADSLGSATNSWDNVYADGLTFDDGSNIMSNYIAPTAFTPVLAFGGASVGITYGSQIGTYTCVGKSAFMNVIIILTSKGSSVGAATITGFPLTGIASNQISAAGSWSAVNFAANNTQVGVSLGASSSTLSLFQAGDGTAVTTITNTNLVNTSRLQFSIGVMVS